MAIKDLFAEGVANGWQVQHGHDMTQDQTVETDVVIIGTGAGGGIAAEVFTQAGFKVVMIEEGPLRSSADFNMDEREAYVDLYQECAARKTKDKAINILQGRCVGGGTTVNWTTSLETPDRTLNHWQSAHGIRGCSPEDMRPWFERAKQRLNMTEWQVPPNPNNDILKKGCDALGWESTVITRNVNNCANLGYCGTGCPINAKQSMLITTIPEALKANAGLFTRMRALNLEFEGQSAKTLVCEALDDRGVRTTGHKLRVKAQLFILAAGAMGSPALLMRSKAPDPHKLLGKRTFLHPVNITVAIMPDRTDPYYGAPQSIYSDQFLWRDGVAGPMGYKMEVPPLHPLICSTVLPAHGPIHHQLMQAFPYMQANLSLQRDGFHEQSQGGVVELKGDGTPVLNYELNDYVWEGMRHSFSSMMEIQFAAGAKSVIPMHRDVTKPYTSWSEAKKGLAELNLAPHDVRVVSAHVMGGCAMGEDSEQAVVDSTGRHHELENCYVFDGSIFPTSLGANPQLSIYGMTLKNASALAASLDA